MLIFQLYPYVIDPWLIQVQKTNGQRICIEHLHKICYVQEDLSRDKIKRYKISSEEKKEKIEKGKFLPKILPFKVEWQLARKFSNGSIHAFVNGIVKKLFCKIFLVGSSETKCNLIFLKKINLFWGKYHKTLSYKVGWFRLAMHKKEPELSFRSQ